MYLVGYLSKVDLMLEVRNVHLALMGILVSGLTNMPKQTNKQQQQKKGQVDLC